MERTKGELYWILQKEFEMGSLHIQRIITDGLSVLFLLAFSLLTLIESFRRRHNVRENIRRDRVFVACSVCCAVIAIAYVCACLWSVLGENGTSSLSWVFFLVRGLIWSSLSVSLILQRSKSTKICILFWWVSSSLLASALNVQVILRTYKISFLDILSWPVNLLLLYCASRLLVHLMTRGTSDQNLSEPLLTTKDEKNKSDLGKSYFLSQLTFSWLNPLLRLGYSKPLGFEDIPSLVSEDEALIAYQSFLSEWNILSKKKSDKSYNLILQALAKVHLKEMIITGMCAFLRALSVVVAPLLLYAFVEYSNLEVENLHYGLLLVGCLVVVKLVESFSQRHWFFKARRSGMRMRSALMVAVYQKQLNLSSLGRKRHSTGEIVNYIAVDAYRLGEFPFWFHSTWTYVIQLFLAIGVLYGVVGLGSLPGLVPLFICGILNIPYAKTLQKCQSQFMVAQDERLRATSEVLNNMKVIKLHSWEEKFKNLIDSLRENEFKWLTKSQIMKANGTALYWMSPTLISAIVFVGCVLIGSAPLNASTIFTVLATLRTMAEPVRMIPEALSVMIQVKVSLDRLETFLLDDELKNQAVRKTSFSDQGISIRILSGVFGWNTDTSSPTLKAIDLTVKMGQKVAICGSVGSGKSSLLYAVLGEMPQLSGQIDVFGSIAYVSQTAWIQSGTVRDNILYGKTMDNTRYGLAIKSCALDKDIDSFSHGDLTEIGQRGINMSGGQKQRIQLARAVYNDADIYLLDDPFSAVDAHTAATLFNNCVMGALEKKTVILVTHQVEFLAEVDRILVMKDGNVTQSGNYEDLLTAGTAFEQLVHAHRNSMTTLDPANTALVTVAADKQIDLNHLPPTKGNSEAEISVKGVTGVQLTEAEEMEIGDVGWKPFFDYLTVSKGLWFLILSIVSQSSFVALQAAATYWLALAKQIPDMNNGTLIGVYTGISALSAFCVYLRSYFAAHLGLKASRAFFSGFTDSVFRAPMLFFDSTPVGRILTRASSDLSVLDFDIPFSTAFVIAAGIETLSSIGIMASVTWPVLIVGVLAIIAVKYVQGYYQSSAREIIRINGTTKAPVMNYAAETSLGVATIRAFNMTNRFFQNYLKLIDSDATLFFHSNASMEWLIIRVEALQNLTLFTATLLLVLLPQGTIPPGYVGLSLSYALALTGTQVFMARWYCNLANYIVSVERIKQFMHIPPEPPAIVLEKRPPTSWPSQGRINLYDLKIRYRPNAPLVLKGITCSFKEGTRVGVVGRTGSGKTTLISALFRLVEPESGKVVIDGLDICSMGLRDLRLKLSIIPQEPTLFKGTVRTNLDPLGLYTDQEIWQAIEKCQLKTTISGLPDLLDASVSDEGDNWSVGQRQLFCLGRVLLKRNKILVLDEATASIDSATDAILQKVIRKEFSDCTVITVAHRVPTVVDSDMVMVLSYGKLLEYDSPSKLMETNSSFSKLVAEYWASCRRSSMQNLYI